MKSWIMINPDEMSATQIPNLDQFRRRAPRGRGRDGTIGSIHKSQDEIIQNTDNDAAMSRLSAVDAGYLYDSFARLLTSDEVQRRLPLMNRGTYVRTTGIDKVVTTFVSSQAGRKQIISFGAGSDTRYFRLKQEQPDLDLIYHELDFATNTKAKIAKIKHAAVAIAELCGIDVNESQGSDKDFHLNGYHIHAQDLRHIQGVLPGIDNTLPTLLISECCLIYLSPEDAEEALAKFTEPFHTLSVVIYEPIRPNDAFGKTMVRNLIARGIQLQTLERFAELNNQKQRLQDHGLEGHAADINTVWNLWIDPAEKERVEKLEWMDEVEEFVLLGRHYCISWGWKGFADDNLWRGLPES